MFNCDFLREEKRYTTFPVDFLKAETIFFPKKFVQFYSLHHHKSSWKIGVLIFFENDEHRPKTVIRQFLNVIQEL